jgi:Ca2+-binding RTX toxin-like protein
MPFGYDRLLSASRAAAGGHMNGPVAKEGRQPDRARARRPRWLALSSAILPAIVLAADIVGTNGPDVLEGTPEADTINGRGGADVMMGLAGNDTYTVDLADDEVLEAVGDGTDSVRSTVSYTLPINVENLRLIGTAAANATGNSLDNQLTGNLANNILSGRAGADRMSGGDGDDTYIVDETGDRVVEAAGEGTDTIRSAVTFTLPANVESLRLTGSAAVSANGNELANSITGNAANNTLRGMAGNDTLSGGSGNDRLIGSTGNDRITCGGGQDIVQFDTELDPLANLDSITDFNPADDEIRLIGAAFPTLSTAGALPASAFGLGTVAATAAVRILYDPATGFMRYDPDGSGSSAAVRFGRLLNTPTVTNADFVVVNPVVVAVVYSSEIQPIFNGRCIGCHSGSSAPQGLKLDSANSFSNLVNVASHEVPSLKRVKPGDPDNSYLVQKIEGTAAVGSRMPLGGSPLSADQIALIRRWISEGANP